MERIALVDYKEHPKSCAPDDFWGQVKRTIGGKPVDQAQIDMIVSACLGGLDLQADDVLLDLCCGNGALSRLIFEHCSGGLGVDFSQVLINVAKTNFERPGREHYLLGDVVEFVSTYPDPQRFTKAVCYGSLQYLPRGAVGSMLRTLRTRCPRLQRLFIGNVPDRARAASFFGDRPYDKAILDDPTAAIGIWWSKEEFHAVALELGWNVEFCRMPRKYYNAYYRFDAILLPKGERL